MTKNKFLLVALILLFFALGARAQDTLVHGNRVPTSCTSTTELFYLDTRQGINAPGFYKCNGSTYAAHTFTPAPQAFTCAACVGDNVADDTAALQALINSTPNGSLIYFPPGKRYKITSTITFTEKKALTLTSFIDARNFSATAPRFTWAGGSNGVMFDLVRCQTTHIAGFYFNKSAGTVSRAIRIDGSGGGQVSTADVVQYNSFDFSNQANAAFAAVSMSDAAPTNNENNNVSYNHIICSSGIGAAAVGAGIYNGASPNAKHQVLYENGVSQCAYGLKLDGGSWDIRHVGGGNNNFDVYARGNSEPVTIYNIECENSVHGVDIETGAFGNTVTLDNYRIENSQQAAYFLRLRGNVTLQNSYVYSTPGGGETLFETAIDGVGLTLTSFHNTYIDGLNQPISTAKLGWDAIQIVGTFGSSIYSYLDVGIVDSVTAAAYARGALSFQPFMSVTKGSGVGSAGYVSRPTLWDEQQRFYGVFGGNNGGLAISNTETIETSNAYFDGSNWKRIYLGTATRIKQTAGVITLETAISGAAGANITWVASATLDAANGLTILGPLFKLGGATGAFPALRNTGARLDVVNADNNAYQAVNASSYVIGAQSIFGAAGDGIYTFGRSAGNGFRMQGGPPPTIGSGFGTSPSIIARSTDTAGSVNVGTGGVATSGVINFNGTWADAPYCIVQDTTTGILQRGVATTTTLTITSSSAWTASDKIVWQCIGTF